MQNFKDSIARLSKSKSTKLKIGTRATPHRLTKLETKKFQIAIQKGYLDIENPQRENLENLFTTYKNLENYEPIILRKNPLFPTAYKEIIQKINTIDPEEYQKTRNFLDGAVSLLSAYISRGVISPKELLKKIIEKNPNLTLENQYVKEVVWREYFLRVRENLKDKILENINPINDYESNQIPSAILKSNTGINQIDKELYKLYSLGYIHNHSRMWIASIVSNIAKTNWQVGAKFMYYHLLDCDIASNYLSWQWIAGTFSFKKYFANQDNINFFSKTTQVNTFLSKEYDELKTIDIPEILKDKVEINFTNQVRQIKSTGYLKDTPTLLYSFWNLDPNWHLKFEGTWQKILLLEPRHFDKFPVSSNVLAFVIRLAKQIPNLKIVISDFDKLKIPLELLVAKENINTIHWKVGKIINQEYIFPSIVGYFPNFSSYWKECLKIGLNLD